MYRGMPSNTVRLHHKVPPVNSQCRVVYSLLSYYPTALFPTRDINLPRFTEIIFSGKNFENFKLQNLRILFVPTFVLNLFLVRNCDFRTRIFFPNRTRQTVYLYWQRLTHHYCIRWNFIIGFTLSHISPLVAFWQLSRFKVLN